MRAGRRRVKLTGVAPMPSRFRCPAGTFGIHYADRTKEARHGRTNEPLPVVEIVHLSYQPSKAELEDDARVDATFEALLQPVGVRHIPRLRRKAASG